MTQRKHFKGRVRARMSKTAESYATARHQVVQQAKPATELNPEHLKEITGMSNEAVEKKTGRDWNKWVAILDAAKADQMKHSEIARYVHEKHQIPGWWAQTVTVGYERVRGLRAINEKSDGFAISKSLTLKVGLSTLYQAWDDDEIRRRWLDEDFTIRKATPEKSMRITWSDGRTNLDVYFYAKGEGKSQVNIQHSKLRDGEEARSSKQYWAEKFALLKRLLVA